MSDASNPQVNAAPLCILAQPGSHGYHIITVDGGAFEFGGAPFLGSLGGIALSAPIISATLTPTGAGVLMLGKDGAVYALGDAQYAGRVHTA